MALLDEGGDPIFTDDQLLDREIESDLRNLSLGSDEPADD